MSRAFAERFREQCELHGVSCFVPPSYGISVADERTEGMVSVYLFMIRQTYGFESQYQHLCALARSCYLQGVEDAAIAMAQQSERNTL